MSRERKKTDEYLEHAAGVLTEVSLALAIFAGGLIVIVVLGLLFD